MFNLSCDKYEEFNNVQYLKECFETGTLLK